MGVTVEDPRDKVTEHLKEEGIKTGTFRRRGDGTGSHRDEGRQETGLSLGCFALEQREREKVGSESGSGWDTSDPVGTLPRVGGVERTSRTITFGLGNEGKYMDHDWIGQD